MPSVEAPRAILFVALIAISQITESGTVSAQGCPEIVGRWPYGQATRVAAEGDLAFAVVGSTLTVFDVGDPSDPTPIGELLLLNARIEEYAERVRVIADLHGAPVIDHRLSVLHKAPADLFIDATHPTAEGNRIMAGDLARKLVEIGLADSD